MTKEKTTDLSKYLRVQEAAEFMGVTASYLYRLVYKKAIPYYKSRGGKLTYFLREDLEAWMTSTRVEPQNVLTAQAERQALSM